MILHIVETDEEYKDKINHIALEELDNYPKVGAIIDGYNVKSKKSAGRWDFKHIKDITDLAQEIFKVDIKLGNPNSINGLTDITNNPRYATTIGLIKFAEEKKIVKLEQENDYEVDFTTSIKNTINKFINYLNIK